MRLTKLHHLLAGAVIGMAVIVPIGVFAFVKSGLFDVGASSPHTKFTQWITHETMIHSVRRNAASVSRPSRFNPGQVVAGFCAYRAHCAACHGAAAAARKQWADGMEPQPPYLLDVQQRFTPEQLFWIVRNGIKMTGMPSWGGSMSDSQIWSIVAWLEVSPRLPPRTYVRWGAQVHCPSYRNGLLAAP